MKLEDLGSPFYLPPQVEQLLSLEECIKLMRRMLPVTVRVSLGQTMVYWYVP